MAAAFNLPVAPFCVGEVDPNLIRYGPPELADLGSGYVFASQVVDNVLELAWSHVGAVGVTTRRDLVVFDYWVHNQDRTLTELGGNPNLLWEPTGKDLIVIDHNQAFDDTFDNTTFFQTHVFAQSWNDVYQDFFDRPRYEHRMRVALERFEDVCDRMPESWLIVDDGVPGGLQPDHARAMLMEFSQDNFWDQR
ncbi:hypothetical protein GGD41_006158 [Paraburkholderia bryophila]|uniref:HipA-like kinase domain-containing protein n=2 Tax=Paraburkholderia bryophila TaxID=420952 RepID=A0A7Y9WEJ2_9BURK|nr:hypothetical protein [Paraburkholderia bryophila]